MSFLDKFLILLLTCAFSGCVASIEAESIYSSPQHENEVSLQCQELKKIGNVAVLSDQIDAEMNLIEDAIGTVDSDSYDYEIKPHVELIQKYTEQMIGVLNSQFAKIEHTQFLRWNLKINHPQSAKIDKVVLWNGENAELSKQFQVKIHSQGVTVQLIRPASLIELCQLERLMNAMLSVTTIDEDGTEVNSQYRLKVKGKK